jgi:hypothetical protein
MDSKNQNYSNEAKAIETIGKVFSSLSDDAKQRVLNWAGEAFGLKVPQIKSSTVDDELKGNLPPKKVKELWAQKQPKTNHQKFAVLAYHLEINEKKTEFNSQDLRKAWGDTREATPTERSFEVSLNDTLTKYHYLVKGSKKGVYRLGSRGEKLVAALPKPSKEVIGAARKGISKRKRIKQ